ncbi:MAG: DsbA family protein [Candidatus Bipolaricaulota bacterium]|nr:DsbA family protein [Candidatus Bipolaricaulota bacterium]MDW8030729.1 thioredoxin domain-containing protein [Candidatus Bipolaricaulota bacterium]
MRAKRQRLSSQKTASGLPWYRQPMLVGLAVGGAVIVGLVVLIIVFSRPAEESFQVTRPVGQDFLPEMGDPNAPVTVYEYADYQCPACGYFVKQYKPRIDSDYIQTGKVRWIFKNFAFLGPESVWAAEAAYCAAEQGGFWAYHDKLFANQRGENRGAFSKPNLVRFARELGLKVDDFQQCLESGRYREKIQNELREGQAQGINSTPSFLVNGQLVRGADYLRLRELIERNLP